MDGRGKGIGLDEDGWAAVGTQGTHQEKQVHSRPLLQSLHVHVRSCALLCTTFSLEHSALCQRT